MKRIMGVDEAGRGPVLGPLVVGAVVAEESSMEGFRELGVRDSKALTRKARERIYDRLVERYRLEYELILPAAINHPDSNLSQLEYDTVSVLVARHEPDLLVVDAFLPPEKLAKRLTRQFPSVAVIAEWKADENYPIVSAASIVAKVIRDREVDRLKDIHGDLGSGYPGDPKTKTWLKRELLKNRLVVQHLPECVRVKWSTVRRLRDEPP